MQQNNTHNHSRLEQNIKAHLSHNQMPLFEHTLLEKILGRLEYQQQLQFLKPRLLAGFITCALSIAMLALSVSFSAQAFAHTGLAKYFSLLFTDFGQVVTNWQDFSYSILESLPLGAVATLLGAIFTSVWLIDFGAHQFLNFKKLNRAGYSSHRTI